MHLEIVAAFTAYIMSHSLPRDVCAEYLPPLRRLGGGLGMAQPLEQIADASTTNFVFASSDAEGRL